MLKRKTTSSFARDHRQNFLERLNRFTGLIVAIVGILITVFQFINVVISSNLSNTNARIEIAKCLPKFEISEGKESFHIVDLNNAGSFYRYLEIRVIPVLMIERVEVAGQNQQKRMVAIYLDRHAYSTYLSIDPAIVPHYSYRLLDAQIDKYFGDLWMKGESPGYSFGIKELIVLRYDDIIEKSHAELYYPDDWIYRLVRENETSNKLAMLSTLPQIDLYAFNLQRAKALLNEKSTHFVPIDQSLMAIGFPLGRDVLDRTKR